MPPKTPPKPPVDEIIAGNAVDLKLGLVVNCGTGINHFDYVDVTHMGKLLCEGEPGLLRTHYDQSNRYVAEMVDDGYVFLSTVTINDAKIRNKRSVKERDIFSLGRVVREWVEVEVEPFSVSFDIHYYYHGNEIVVDEAVFRPQKKYGISSGCISDTLRIAFTRKHEKEIIKARSKYV